MINQKMKIINNRNTIAEIINKILSIFENFKNLLSFVSFIPRFNPYQNPITAIIKAIIPPKITSELIKIISLVKFKKEGEFEWQTNI